MMDFWHKNWARTKWLIDRALSWISYYELKEATTIFELAMWKAKINEMIEEMGSVDTSQRNFCRVDVPGPAKNAILQYLKYWEDVGTVEESEDEGSYNLSSDEDDY